MSESQWVPFSVRRHGAEAVEAHAALHEDLMPWQRKAVLEWLRCAITDPLGDVDEGILTPMRLSLQADIAGSYEGHYVTRDIHARGLTWDAVDFVLSTQEDYQCRPNRLEEILRLGGSAWTVGALGGRRALVERVPSGVQKAASEAFKADKAGPELARAWEALYGRNPDPAIAYYHAVKAVEHLAIPQISPKDKSGTLGKVASHVRDNKQWGLPLTKAEPAEVHELLRLMLKLLPGNHTGRHGADEFGDATKEDAEVAVGLAVTLVHWFSRGLVRREESA
ncbi:MULTISPECIES: hypothetical protein [Micrococcus]|uniref:hypothetical protein n=1 Tax=Micrococcus TaxID=1269 RepID=UPI0010151051|nr:MULTISPECIES: hypothetical protein [Micrococcus]QTP19076.1 hypothetical protein J7660_03330 [Micrococcus luteus]RYD01091.1 hypothetical protein SJ20_00570 [Micrococcus sp. MS-ASIII-49]